MDLPATVNHHADRADLPGATPNAAARRLFRLINKMVEPLVRLGFGSPNAGPGLVVVETIGHRTGLPRRVPLLGLRAGESVIVTTCRSHSTWVRNLEDEPQAEVWSGGIRRRVTADVHRLSTGAYVRLNATRKNRPCFYLTKPTAGHRISEPLDCQADTPATDTPAPLSQPDNDPAKTAGREQRSSPQHPLWAAASR